MLICAMDREDASRIIGSVGSGLLTWPTALFGHPYEEIVGWECSSAVVSETIFEDTVWKAY